MLQPSKYSPVQISFTMAPNSNQLDLILIFKDEGNGIVSFHELKFENHVVMEMSKVANSHLFNFEFREMDGKTVLLSNVIRDLKTFNAVQDRLNLVKIASLTFYKIGDDGKPQLISASLSGSYSIQLQSGIQSFETSTK